MPLEASPWRCFGHVQPGEDPWGRTRALTFLIWPANTLASTSGGGGSGQAEDSLGLPTEIEIDLLLYIVYLWVGPDRYIDQTILLADITMKHVNMLPRLLLVG